MVSGEEVGTLPHTHLASTVGVTLVGAAAVIAESGRSRLRRDSADSKHSDGTGNMFFKWLERRGGMMSSKCTHGTRDCTGEDAHRLSNEMALHNMFKVQIIRRSLKRAIQKIPT